MRKVLQAGVAQLVEQLICNQQVGGSNPSTSSTKALSVSREEYPSGQRGQTVNLLAMPTMVRIHPPPPRRSKVRFAPTSFFAFGKKRRHPSASLPLFSKANPLPLGFGLGFHTDLQPLHLFAATVQPGASGQILAPRFSFVPPSNTDPYARASAIRLLFSFPEIELMFYFWE